MFDRIEPIICVTESMPIFCRDKNVPFLGDGQRFSRSTLLFEAASLFLGPTKRRQLYTRDRTQALARGMAWGADSGSDTPRSDCGPPAAPAGHVPPLSPRLPPAEPRAAPARLRQHLPRGSGGQEAGQPGLSPA